MRIPLVKAGVVTYSVARRRQGRPVRRRMERLLDFCSDDPAGQEKKKKKQISAAASRFSQETGPPYTWLSYQTQLIR